MACDIAIIGGGPAGCMAAYFASQNAENSVTIFEEKSLLKTILPTGGGRCNLAYSQYDFRDLVKFYPRGEKFMLSILSKFSTTDTIEFFKNIGVETYIQEDLRIFPTSNSAKFVRAKFIESIKHCGIRLEKVIKIYHKGKGFSITTNKGDYQFDKVIIAVGGHAGFGLAENLGHKIIPPKPSLTGFYCEKDYSELKGVCVEATCVKVLFDSKNVFEESGSVLFTHKGVSGPTIYKISSTCARFDYSRKKPLKIFLKFLPENIDFQKVLEENPKKDIRNLIAEFVPKSFADYVLKTEKIKADTKCFEINKVLREKILKSMCNFEIVAVSPFKDGEVVTSGGVDLDEINSKDMQSKIVNGLYFCGEIIDVDGFCGGFNLQNCWSTGFIAGTSV